MMGTEIFLALNSYGAFQPYSTQVTEKRLEERDVQRVEERVVHEEGDSEIIGSSKK